MPDLWTSSTVTIHFIDNKRAVTLDTIGVNITAEW